MLKKAKDNNKLDAASRIKLLLDNNSFVEIDEHVEIQSTNYNLQDKKQKRDGVITGYGTINKKQVFVYAQDFGFMGGSMGEMHNKKIYKILEMALKTGCPVIGLLDSGGARIQEGINSLDGGGLIFKTNTFASGVIPQISAIMGPCAGIAVYSPALTDFVFMVDKTSYMFITGPDVIKSVTGEEINFEKLGGAHIHNEKSGVANFLTNDDRDCLLKIRKLLSYLPQNNLESPPNFKVEENSKKILPNLAKLIPWDTKKSYDIKSVINEVVDKGSFFEIHEHFAQNAVIGFARLHGIVIGIVANQPKVLAGVLDINSSDKISKFVRFCDSFNIPLINFVDVPGYLPGTDQEHNGIIRHGAKILYAYSEATVPKISFVLRKAYGGAYIALVSKDMGFDYVIALETAEIAVMGAEQAVNIIHKKESNKEEKIKEFKDMFLNPYVAAKQGKVDQIVAHKDIRIALISSLEMLLSKRERRVPKKHGNLPL